MLSSSSPAAPTSILIVDDHPNIASMLARALTQFERPVQVMTAVNGQEALDRVDGIMVMDVEGGLQLLNPAGQRLFTDGEFTPHQSDCLSRIQKAAKQMLDMVQNLLELARIDLGVDLKLEPCNMRDLLTRVVDEFQAQAASRGQNVKLLPFEGHAHIMADTPRLRQVLRNLIGNAIKCTPGGEVTITGVIENDVIQIEIRDTGAGIAPTCRSSSTSSIACRPTRRKT